VAKALGVVLPFSAPEKWVEEVAQSTADNISSMFQDVLRGAPTEVDAINGAVVRKGEEKKICTPVNHVVWSLVRALPSVS
jgi:2-dehydropantoate 2-reductase